MWKVSTRLTVSCPWKLSRSAGVLAGERGELLDVRSGNEIVRLARDQDHRAGRRVIAQLVQQPLELVPDGGGQLVDRLARQIEGEHGDAVFVLRG